MDERRRIARNQREICKEKEIAEARGLITALSPTFLPFSNSKFSCCMRENFKSLRVGIFESLLMPRLGLL